MGSYVAVLECTNSRYILNRILIRYDIKYELTEDLDIILFPERLMFMEDFVWNPWSVIWPYTNAPMVDIF